MGNEWRRIEVKSFCLSRYFVASQFHKRRCLMSIRTYVGDVVDVGGLRQQLNALRVVSLYGKMQRGETATRARRQ